MSILLLPFADILANEVSLLGGVVIPDEIASALESVSYYDFTRFVEAGTLDAAMTLVIDGDVALPAPGIHDLQLVFGGGIAGATSIRAHLRTSSLGSTTFTIEAVRIALRFPRDWLRPVRDNSREILDGFSEMFVEGDLAIAREGELGLAFSPRNGVNLPRSMVGSTGVIISASDVEARLFGPERGIYIKQALIELPPDIGNLPDIRMSDCSVTADGFTGSISAEWTVGTVSSGGITQIDTDSSEVVATLFSSDFKLAVRSIKVSFDKNRLTEFGITGLLQFPPSVLDTVLEADIGIADDGQFIVAVRAAPDDAIIKLTKKDLFELSVSSVIFEHTAEQTAFTVDGDLKITAVDALGKIGLKGFSIYKAGSDPWAFKLKGGTYEVNKSFELAEVVRIDLKEIGFEKDGGCSALLISAGAQLLEGMQGGASVKGLRIPWCTDPQFTVGPLSFDGIGCEFAVPDTLAFVGSVERKDEGDLKYFQGEIGLYLMPVELEIGAAIKVGKNKQCRFGFLSAYVIWPGPGFPIGCLPLYLRGLKGLIGGNVTPDADAITDYYPLSEKEPVGLESPTKWRDECGSGAIGVGAFISTASPKLFNMEALVAFMYPQLRLAIQGSAFILETPKPGKKPPLQALMLLDIKEPAALLNVGAKYEWLKGVYKVDGMLEAYYGPDPQNPSTTTSYFAIGQVKPYFPEDRPVRGTVFKIWSSDSYFIVMKNLWALGASIGLPKKKYSFKFASVHFEAYMRAGGEVYWAPVQFKGSASLKGNVGFRVFGKGFDLSLSAHVDVMAPDYLIDANLHFGVKFHIPFHTIEIGGSVPFHWEKRRTPPVPALLKEITLTHALTGKGAAPYLLIRNVSAGDPVLGDVSDLALIPDVDPDTFAAIEFAFPTKDETGLPFGQNVVSVPPTKSGDYTFTGRLAGQADIVGVRMRRRRLCAPGPDCNVEWEEFRTSIEDVASPFDTAAAPYLFGAWQAAEDPSGLGFATHLWLSARTPFDFNRPTRISAARLLGLVDVMQTAIGAAVIQPSAVTAIGSSTATAQIAAASSATAAPSAIANQPHGLMQLPVYETQLRTPDRLRAFGKPLPYRGLQYAVNEDPNYPYTGARFTSDGKLVPRDTEFQERCANFLRTRIGPRRPYEIIVLGQDDIASPSAEGDVLVSGHASAHLNGHLVDVGNLEIVQQRGSPYSLRWLEAHCSRGLDAQGKLTIAGQRLSDSTIRFAFKQRVRSLIIHCDDPAQTALLVRFPPACLTSDSVHGVVVDCEGIPISAARVTVEHSRLNAITDAKGRFCIRGCFYAKERVGLRADAGSRGAGRVVAQNDGLAVALVLGESRSTAPIAVSAAYQQTYSRATLWTSGHRVATPGVLREPGKIIIRAAQDASFDAIELLLNTALRIFSVCYEIDPTQDLANADDANKGFIDVTWPGRGRVPGSGGPGTDATTGPGGVVWSPGPASIVDDGMSTPDGTIMPGYQYELTVRTSNERSGRSEKEVFKEYVAHFKVPKPSETLSPYVYTGFPRGDGFPHFRGDPIYLKMNRNYVHKLITGFENSVYCQFKRDGRLVGPALPFRDNQDAALNSFETNISNDRRGWGWGKSGDGHDLTKEEGDWLDSYNRSVPADRQITDAMAIPDDVLWAYGINPALIRAEFDGAIPSSGVIGPFDAPVEAYGLPTPNRWSLGNGLLRHQLTPLPDPVPNDSLLLNGGDAPALPLQLSVWLRYAPGATALNGRAGIILGAATNGTAFLTQFALVEVNFASNRIAIRSFNSSALTTVIDRPLTLPSSWSRIQVKATPASAPGKIAITAQVGSEVVLTGEAQLQSASGRVGLVASADFAGDFDNFEALSLSRLAELPDAGAPHELTVEYRTSESTSLMHEHKFVTSKFIDMFDMLNTWDRVVWRSTLSTSDRTTSLSDWTASDNDLRVLLGTLLSLEKEYAKGKATTQDLDAKRQEITDQRYTLDEAFKRLAKASGFELSPRPDRFQFTLSNDGSSLLIEFPEPIDWTRYCPGALRDAESTANSAVPLVSYSSDLTRAIVTLPSSATPSRFESGHTYLWTLQQWPTVPEHFAWLNGWINHRQRSFDLTLEIRATVP